MIRNIFQVSLTTSIVLALAFVFDRLLTKHISARWRRLIWLMMAIRLIVPFSLEIKSAPVKLPEVNYDIAVRAPVIQSMSDAETYNDIDNSERYAPVLSLKELIYIVWAAGAAAVMLYYIGGYVQFRMRIKPHLKKRGGIYVCDKISAPVMTGFFRHIIILPDKEYSGEELRLILLHEQTHIKHGDVWYKLILAAAKALHWFNPLVYVLAAKAERDIEFACDDEVMTGKNIDEKKEYLRTILKSADN